MANLLYFIIDFCFLNFITICFSYINAPLNKLNTYHRQYKHIFKFN